MKSLILNIAVVLLVVINIVNAVQKGFSILNLMAIILCCIVLALNVVDSMRKK